MAVTRRHRAKNAAVDGIGVHRFGQKAIKQAPHNGRIKRQKAENQPPAAQSLQSRAQHRRHQRRAHHNDADQRKHLRRLIALIIVAHDGAHHHHRHARAESLHHAQEQQFICRTDKHQPDYAGDIHHQARERHHAPPFDVGYRAAHELPRRHAEHKCAQTLLDAVDIRTQRIGHGRNRRQIGINGKRHNRHQHGQQSGHLLIA